MGDPYILAVSSSLHAVENPSREINKRINEFHDLKNLSFRSAIQVSVSIIRRLFILWA